MSQAAKTATNGIPDNEKGSIAAINGIPDSKKGSAELTSADQDDGTLDDLDNLNDSQGRTCFCIAAARHAGAQGGVDVFQHVDRVFGPLGDRSVQQEDQTLAKEGAERAKETEEDERGEETRPRTPPRCGPGRSSRQT